MPDFSFSQINLLCNALTTILQGEICLGFSEVSPQKWILTFSSNTLLICLKKPFLRFHLLSKKRSSYKTPFCLELETHFKGQKILHLQVLDEDRILVLTFENQKKILSEFFPKHPNLYLLDADNTILKALFPISKTIYSPPLKKNLSPSTEPLISHEKIEAFYDLLEKKEDFLEKKTLFEKKHLQEIKRLTKKIHFLTEEKEKNSKWTLVQKQGLLLQSNLHLLERGKSSVEVTDWETGQTQTLIFQNPKLLPKEQLAAFFQKARSLKKKEKLTEDRLEQTRKLLEREEKILKDFSLLSSEEEIFSFLQKDFPHENKKTPPKKNPFFKNVWHFVSEAGLPIFVGKNQEGNDFVTFRLAHGEDFWFHASNTSGAHVVIRVPKKTLPDDGSISEAAQLALYYSQDKEKGEGEIFMTQVKHVKKIKHAVGQVSLSHPKKLWIQSDLSIIEKIKKRLLSQEELS